MALRAIVIEDDPAYMTLMLEVLRTAGFHAFPTYKGESAVARVKTLRADLVVTDLEMPDTNGVDVIQALRSDPETAHVTIVAVTAHVWDSIAHAARSVGCDGFVGKPFQPKRLVEEIAKCLAVADAPAPPPPVAPKPPGKLRIAQ